MIFGTGFGDGKNHFFENGLNHSQNPQEPARKMFAGLCWLFEKQFAVIYKKNKGWRVGAGRERENGRPALQEEDATFYKLIFLQSFLHLQNKSNG